MQEEKKLTARERFLAALAEAEAEGNPDAQEMGE